VLVINNENEFFAFFLVYSAIVDYEFHDNERTYLEEKFGKDTVLRALNELENNKAVVFSTLILNYKTYITSAQKQTMLRSEMVHLFKEDGKLCNFETGFLEVFDLIDDP